jgi:hypothetical protein
MSGLAHVDALVIWPAIGRLHGAMISVSALYIYPIKSCRGIEVRAFRLDDLGPQFDRRYMIVDPEGRCINQRHEPRLALVVPSLQPTTLLVRAEGMQALKLPLAPRGDGRVVEVEHFDHRSPALDAGSDAAGWFSEWLGRECRLVYMPNAPYRRVSEKYSPEPAYTSFTDGFPELLISNASIADLSTRCGITLVPERFRPTILVTGCDAYAEDNWRQLRIGDVRFDVVKPCTRCSVTTIDPATGERGKEPLATLAKYRAQDSKVNFGQNCVHRELGSIRVGDPVEVLAAAE